MSCSKWVAVSVAVALCACPALAAPIVDGTVNVGEYSMPPLVDAPEPGMDFFNTGLDIDQVVFDADAVGGSRYMGLTVTAPPFDTNGSASSYMQMTGLLIAFYDSDVAPAPTIIMSLAFSALGFVEDWSFYREVTGPATYQETDFDEIIAGVDYEINTTGALELRISKSAFKVYNGDDPTFPSFVRIQLDDTGLNQDDQISGNVPEPASLMLLAVGGLLAIRRRRR